MDASYFDWREEPSRLSLYSLSLLVVFVGAVGGVVLYIAAVLQPWAGPERSLWDARTYSDRGLTPLPPGQVSQPQ